MSSNNVELTPLVAHKRFRRNDFFRRKTENKENQKIRTALFYFLWFLGPVMKEGWAYRFSKRCFEEKLMATPFFFRKMDFPMGSDEFFELFEEKGFIKEVFPEEYQLTGTLIHTFIGSFDFPFKPPKGWIHLCYGGKNKNQPRPWKRVDRKKIRSVIEQNYTFYLSEDHISFLRECGFDVFLLPYGMSW